MATINFSKDQYIDYSLQGYLNAVGVKNAKVTKKVVSVSGEDTPLVHVEGYQPETGKFVNLDMWPRNHATAEDLEKMPERMGDVKFRIGYFVHTDADSGEQRVVEGQPKWIGYSPEGKGVNEFCVTLSGEKRQFEE